MEKKTKIIVISVSAAVAIAIAVAVFFIVRRRRNSEKKTAKGLVRYAKSQLGRPYWWGTNGQTATPELLAKLQQTYPDQYGQAMYNDAPSQFGQRVHDCAGLIEAYMWSVDGSKDGEIIPGSNNFPDTTANNMYASAIEKGNITRPEDVPEIPGLALHMDRHVGVYIGKGKVVEARGHKFGVVETDLNGRGWEHWFKVPGIEY